MSGVKITVGGPFEDEAARRFVDAWHRAERGESFRERHLTFESWDALAGVRTGKRMDRVLPVSLRDLVAGAESEGSIRAAGRETAESCASPTDRLWPGRRASA